jgi:hypothetical protein
MNNFLNIEIKIKEDFRINSNYIKLEPFAPTTSRTWIFSDINKNINQLEIDDALILASNILEIRIFVLSKSNNYRLLHFYKMYVDDCILLDDTLTISGLLFSTNDMIYDCSEYKQGIIDIYNFWQMTDSNFTIPSNLKKDYLTACIYYNGNWNIIKRDKYVIDWTKIEVEEDFFIQVGYVFCGEKGYAGYSLHTLADCFIDFYKQTDCFQDKKIIFKMINLEKHPLKLFFEEVKAIFLKYDKIDFTVE